VPIHSGKTGTLRFGNAGRSTLTGTNLNRMPSSTHLPEGRLVADIGGPDGDVLIQLLTAAPERRGIARLRNRSSKRCRGR
jgi:hypothetical protein